MLAPCVRASPIVASLLIYYNVHLQNPTNHQEPKVPMDTLYNKTLILLDQCDTSIQDIAEQSKLPYDWLVSVKYRRIQAPSVDRVQKLYEHLSGKKLPV